MALYYPPAYLGDVERSLNEFFSGSLKASRSWRNELDKVALVQKFVRKGSILDVGCGDGKFLWALDGDLWIRYGVEQIVPVVELVHSRMPDLKLIAGTLYTEKLQPASFDAITLWYVLEHLPDPGRVLHRLASLLKPGGWLFLAVPNFGSLQPYIFREHWYAFDPPRHLFHFSRKCLSRLITEAGLTVHKQMTSFYNVNMHHLKYSTIHWSEAKFRSRLLYYLLKPILMATPIVERALNREGMMMLVIRRPSSCQTLHS